jgi:Flp pilus assembly protein TadD
MRQWALLLFASLPLSAADARWIKLTSPNFLMYTTASERNGRETLRYFEQVRGFFVQAMGAIPGKDSPVQIIAFNSKKEYEPYRLNNFAVAYYHYGSTGEGIVLSQTGDEVFPVAIHEYVHLVARHAGLELPPWLSEGLAEIYSTMKPMGDKVLVGSLIPGRYQALLREKWVPLSVIVNVDHASPYYNEKNQAGSLYNEGWALTHMMLLTEAYRPNFSKFLSLVNTGTSTEQALMKVYGKTVPQVDKELQAYLSGTQFKGAIFPQKLEKVHDEFPAVPAAAFDIKFLLADLLNAPGKEKEVRERMEQLAAEDPKRPEPVAALGYLAWHARQTDEAVKDFAKAFELGDREPRMLWDYGRLARGRDHPGAMRALSALLELEPDRLDARMELAAMQLISRQPSAALETLKPVKKVNKEEAPRFFTIVSHAYLDNGQLADAKLNAQQLAKFALTDEDKFQAKQLLDYLDTATKGPAPVMARAPSTQDSPEEHPTLHRHSLRQIVGEPPASDHKFLAGSFAELDCSQTPPKIVIETAEGKKLFLIDDPNKIIGATIELQCGPQKKTTVKVDYVPANQAGVEGLVRGLQFQQ